MNVHSEATASQPSDLETIHALKVVRRWISTRGAGEDNTLSQSDREVLAAVSPLTYPRLSRTYPVGFVPDTDYIEGLPDLQNGSDSLIVGAHERIQHVGISNFRLPVRFRIKDGSEISLETAVTGTVSLEADKKGINMSRIMRSFYRHAASSFSFGVVGAVLDDYRSDLDSQDARIQMKFSFPIERTSLRSELTGYQYYDVVLEQIEARNVSKKIIHLDYVYSSTCPCSLELSEHARVTRGQLATPHSQRSVARISVVLNENSDELWFEDLVELCRAAVPTETQVMVKREDEQAFAELNAANPIFVEDAARSFCSLLQSDKRITDFRVLASHQESLHSHDAVSVLVHGSTFAHDSLEPSIFHTLFHTP